MAKIQGGASVQTGNVQSGTNSIGNVTSSLIGANPWVAGAMGVYGVVDSYLNREKEKRRRELEVEQALARNNAEYDYQGAARGTFAEANRSAKELNLNAVKEAAGENALNATTGMANNMNAGGEVMNGVGDATRGSTAYIGATAPLAQAVANTYGEKEAYQTNLTNQREQNINSRAQISQLTDYINYKPWYASAMGNALDTAAYSVPFSKLFR